MKKNKKIYLWGMLLVGVVLLAGTFLYVLSWSGALLRRNKVIEGKVQPIQYEGEHYVYNEDLINILCLGIDHDHALNQDVLPGERGQSDAIFLISLNSKTREMKILNIPRDLMMPVDIYDAEGNYFNTRTMQITLQYAYGIDEEDSCLKTAQDVSALLLNIPIHRYCAINFNAVPALNDAVGGVTVQMASEYVDAELAKLSPMFTPGNTVHLTGGHSFNYLHVRDIHTYASCEERVERQKQYIKGYIGALKETIKTDPKLLFELYSIMNENMTTDIGKMELPSFYFYIDKMDFEDLVVQIEGERTVGDHHEEFYADEEALERLTVDMFYTLADKG